MPRHRPATVSEYTDPGGRHESFHAQAFHRSARPGPGASHGSLLFRPGRGGYAGQTGKGCIFCRRQSTGGAVNATGIAYKRLLSDPDEGIQILYQDELEEEGQDI
ncbi:MAG: hypothetical protein ACQEQ7_08580 [Thermodesulfobacteriota bacterium]